MTRALLYTVLGILAAYALLRWCTDVSWGNQWWVLAAVCGAMIAMMRVR